MHSTIDATFVKADKGNAGKREVTFKSRLTDKEKSEIIALAQSLVKKDAITSLCAYGPKVAGYSQDDSDYGMIIAVNDLKEKEKKKKAVDRHLDESIRQPLLIVTDVGLLEEASHPSAAESVVSKLLNVYEPVVNREFLLGAELEYKKRVIAEELIEIQSDYRVFSPNLVIPYEYFLFDKLRKRSLLFPHEIHDYVSTYTCAKKEENIEFALRAFREAADSLASGGIIESTGDSVRVFKGKERSIALSKLFRKFPLSTGGAIRFALHEFASKAGVEFKARPLAKLQTMGDIEPIIELDRPKKLLRLEEGVIFDDPGKTVEELAQISGFGETYSYEEKKKGDFVSSTRQLEIWDDRKRTKFILKHFPELKSAKWVILNVWSLVAKKFNMGPLSRLNREVAAVGRLRKLGIRTHRIVGVILDERTLVTEYVEGVPLTKSVKEILRGKSSDTSHIEDYAQVLGKLHKTGLVYGDTKPQNVLVGKDGIDLLDLEQSVENGDAAWDIAEFLYFSATRLEEEDKKQDVKEADGEKKKEEGMKLIAEAFLASYRKENGSQAISKAKNFRYVVPFLPFSPRKMRRAISESLEEYSSMGSNVGR